MEQKHVLKSKTIQGIIGAGAAPVISEGIVALLGLFGVAVSPEPVSKVVLLLSLVYAAYGRYTANSSITIKTKENN
jgi:hypothetical protein